jgi:signal transduction histidine kinase
MREPTVVTRASSRRVSWVVAGGSVAMALTSAVLVTLDRSTIQANIGQPLAVTMVQNVAAPMAAAVGIALIGALITASQPRNRVGWLFSGTGFALALTLFAQEYAVRGLVTAQGSLPGAIVAAWFQFWLARFLLPLVIVVVLLIFPDGQLHSPAWWPVLSIAVVGAAAQVLESLNNPFGVPLGIRTGDHLFFFPVTMPPALWPIGRFVDRWGHGIETWAGLIAVIAAGAALLLRLQRAQGEQRLQIKWLAYAGGVTAVGVAVSHINDLPVISRDPHPLLNTMGTYGDLTWTLAAAIGIPLAAGIAILKHRLYDIDVVVNKTIVFGGLAAFITVVYTVVVVGVSAAIGSGTRFNPGLSILATAIVAVAFQPAKERMQRVANRVVYGRRASPYEALSQFAEGVATSYETEEVLPLMARIAAEGTGAARVDVWLRLGTELRLAASWPATDARSRAIPVAGEGDDPPSISGAEHVYPVRHQGELLGALSVRKPPGERMTPAEAALLAHLASQAGPVLANVRLVRELRASRLRLVSVQDEARRRVERDLHDGAQQRLLTLSMVLRVIRKQAESEASALGATIDEAERELKLALDELRELARGIHPAILARSGLGPALASLAERSEIPVELVARGSQRYPAPVESTVYFVVSEALANVAKYAQAARVSVSVTNPDGIVQVEVADDGVGGADASAGSGLLGLRDRVEALGGTFRVESPAGAGTRITARIPCA